MTAVHALAIKTELNENGITTNTTAFQRFAVDGEHVENGTKMLWNEHREGFLPKI